MRRAAVVTFVWMLSCAAAAREAAAAPPVVRPDEIPRVTAELRRLGYAVRDSSAGTRGLVVVLSDVHMPEITGATLEAIDSLLRALPFAAVGLENYDHDFRNLRREGAPPGPVVAALDSMLGAVSPDLVEWARAVVRKRWVPMGSTIDRFVSRHRERVFGIERGDSSMLFVRAAFLYSELVADRWMALRDSASTFDPNGASHRIKARGIETLGAFVTSADPSCPRLPAGLEWGGHAEAELKRVLDAFGGWLNRYVSDDRNRGFAESVGAELASRRATRAVVVVGYGHTTTGGEWPNLQQRLRESGEGVIVADPPAVRDWVEKTGAGMGAKH
jgi:hypothetical protein